MSPPRAGSSITYIDRDSESLFKDHLKNKRIQSDLERLDRTIGLQIERAAALLQSSTSSSPPPLSGPKADSADPSVKSDGTVAFTLLGKLNLAKEAAPAKGSKVELGDEPESQKNAKRKKIGSCSGGSSVLDELMEEEEKAKERSNRKDYWLREGVVVKVMSKALADEGYYKLKGMMTSVIDKYVGEIEMLESKHVLRVDKEELETVILQIGGLARILNGAHRESTARLMGINTETYCAMV